MIYDVREDITLNTKVKEVLFNGEPSVDKYWIRIDTEAGVGLRYSDDRLSHVEETGEFQVILHDEVS